MSEGKMRRLTIRAGVTIIRRSDGKRERAVHDHDVLALPSTSNGGRGEDAWSFIRGGKRKEFWYVMNHDVCPSDFPDREGHRR